MPRDTLFDVAPAAAGGRDPRDLFRLAREQAAQYRRESGPHLALACLALVLHALVLAQVAEPEDDR